MTNTLFLLIEILICVVIYCTILFISIYRVEKKYSRLFDELYDKYTKELMSLLETTSNAINNEKEIFKILEEIKEIKTRLQ